MSYKNRILSLIFPVLLFLTFVTFVVPAQAEVKYREKTHFKWYHVHGNHERSFYPAYAGRYLFESEAKFKKIMYDDDEVYGNIFVRSTDDKLIDPQTQSIERFYTGVRNEDRDVVIGDFYASFSKHSLTNSLKGAKLELGARDAKTRVIMVAGADTSRWEDLWETRQHDSNGRTWVAGARIENNLLDKRFKLNFDYGWSKDDRSYVRAGTRPTQVHVGTVDWDLKMLDFVNFTGEFGTSYFEQDNVTQTTDLRPKFDTIFTTALKFKTKMYRLKTEYLRVEPHFRTTSGFAPNDKEEFKLDGTMYLPLKTTFRHYLNLQRDNLDKLRTRTTKQINPGFVISYKLPQKIRLDLLADVRKRYSSNKRTSERTDKYTVKLGKRFKICNVKTSYTKTYIENYVNKGSGREKDKVSLKLDGRFKLKDVRISWNLGEDVEVQEYVLVCENDIRFTHTAGLKMMFPSTLTFKANARVNYNDYYRNASDSNAFRYKFEISRTLVKDLVLSGKYEQNDYYFADGDNNFFENIITAQITYKF